MAKQIKLKEFHSVWTGNEVQVLKEEGFILPEIRELLEGLHTSLDHEAMVAYRRSRIQWWNDRRRAGYTKGEISKAIRGFYKDTRHTFWEDFRANYIPSPRKKSPEAYRKAAHKAEVARKQARVISKPMYHLLKFKPRQPVTVTLKGKSVTF